MSFLGIGSALRSRLCAVLCAVLCAGLCAGLCAAPTSAHAKPRLPKELSDDAEVARWVRGLPDAPPQAQLALRRWEHQRAQAQKERAAGTAERAAQPSWLRALGGFMPQAWLNANGLGAALPSTPEELARRRLALDEHTGAKAPPLSYELSFIPSVQPHGRGEVFNRVREDGALSVEAGATLEHMSRELRLAGCLRAPVEVSSAPTSSQSLMLSDGRWVAPESMDLACLRARCAEEGGECFIAALRVADWGGEVRSVLSVSPAQRLIVERAPPRGLRMLRDEASNYYLASAPLPSSRGRRSEEALADISSVWRGVAVLHLLIWSPRSYFTGSWEFGDEPISSRAGEPEALLPEHLRREARRLYPLLGVSEEGGFQEMLYRLVSWFRAFKLGELTAPEGEAMSEGADLYRRVMLSQRGVCRHRSYAFMITARALGVPTRLVRNSVHAFVEVRDPRGLWRRVDLGGEAVIERFSSASPLIDTREAEGGLRLPDGLPEHPGGEQARRAAAQEQLREFYEQPAETRAAVRSTSPLSEALEDISEEAVARRALEPSEEGEWERVRRQLGWGEGAEFGRGAEGAEGAEGEEGAEVGRGAQAERVAGAERLNLGSALPPLSDSPGLDLSLRAYLTQAPRTSSEAGAPRGERARRSAAPPAGAEGEQGAEQVAGDAARDATECHAPQRARPAPALKPPRPPLRRPALTAALSRASETRVSRCAQLRVEGAATGAPHLRGAVVRLYAQLGEERRDLGSWAALSAAGRFRLSAQVPADAPLGALRLMVRLEEQGGLEAVEVEVLVAPK